MGKDLIYRASTWILTLVLKTLFRLEVVGRENIPKGRGVLLVSRHRSYWDIPILIAALGSRNRIYFVGRNTLLKNPFFYPFAKGFAILINREHFGREDYRKILAAIEADRIVGIFPEGTTHPTDQIRVGTIRFAEHTQREFLPVRLEAEGPYPPRYPFGFPHMTARIGRPFELNDLERDLTGEEERRERYEHLGSRLMDRIDQVGLLMREQLRVAAMEDA
ncbi:MAG: hypothetical protein A2Z21_04905 [Candidatus Fraserbacteria bacterium RBG_16_55_9]|uniref:Phospholipid/glycerol acyltransferase domain-containing protein n=1 Tax=Fraserbacteria sp. (strain RBG_16_55_9) TaxID=1817864 RepID=A0A1F5UPW8_FRAXR|nr:MAG: hypothetical protein A2Z21_04905 [Candidatus Fraserbacteria bacterium RBG_16_55_9]